MFHSTAKMFCTVDCGTACFLASYTSIFPSRRAGNASGGTPPELREHIVQLSGLCGNHWEPLRAQPAASMRYHQGNSDSRTAFAAPEKMGITLKFPKCLTVPCEFPHGLDMIWSKTKPNHSPGWWCTYPSEKYEFVSWDYYSQYMETHVPNHQPVTHVYPANTNLRPSLPWRDGDAIIPQTCHPFEGLSMIEKLAASGNLIYW